MEWANWCTVLTHPSSSTYDSWPLILELDDSNSLVYGYETSVCMSELPRIAVNSYQTLPSSNVRTILPYCQCDCILLSIDVLGYNQSSILSFRCSIPAWQLNICTICIARLQAEACHCSFSSAVTACPVLLWAPSLYYFVLGLPLQWHSVATVGFSLWHCDLILALKKECWGFQPVCNWTVWLAIISFPNICHWYLITNNW